MPERGPIFVILPRRLYLSGTWHKLAPERRRAELAARGIGCVVNVGKVDDTWPSYGVAYTYVHAPDSFKRVPAEALLRAGDALAAALRVGTPALAMCYGGRNRSATIAALALMRAEGYPAAEAMATIRAVKPTTFLNDLTRTWLEGLE